MRKLLENAEHILVGGHRGCACRFPENSIAAMNEGCRLGASYLEIDIQLSKDEIPVVYHDVRLEQKTTLTGYVHEYTMETIKEQVPGLCTLKEVMEWGRKDNRYFGLELKTVPIDMQQGNLRLVEIIDSVLRQTSMTQNVFLFGQDYQVLRRIKEINKELETGLIVPFVPEDPVSLMKSMNALIYLSYIYNMTPKIIGDLQEQGYYVSGAILREDRWVQRAVQCGVNMFESDDPQAALHLIKQT